MEFFTRALKKYADFDGRDTRQQYWMYVLFYFIFAVVAGILDAVLGIELLSVIYALAVLVPSISITARRLHDTDRSGWWQLISLIPVIGFIVLIVFTVQDSDPNTNRFGANPKA